MPVTIKSWLSHLGCLTIGWTFAYFVIETRQPDIVDSREAGEAISLLSVMGVSSENSAASSTNPTTPEALLALLAGHRGGYEVHLAISDLNPNELQHLARDLTGLGQAIENQQLLTLIYEAWAEVAPLELADHFRAFTAQRRLKDARSVLEALAKVDPELARRTFDSLTPREKESSAYGLTTTLAKAHPVMALKILQDFRSTNPHQRVFQIIAASDPHRAIAHLDSITHPYRKREAIRGILSAWAPRDLNKAFTWAKNLTDRSDREAALSEVMRSVVVDRFDEALKLAEAEPRSAERTRLLNRLVAAGMEHGVTEAWDVLENASEADKQRLLGSLRSALANQPDRALDLAMTLSPGNHHRERIIESAIRTLVSRDLSAAVEAFLQLDLPDQDRTTAEGLVREWAAQAPHEAAAFLEDRPELGSPYLHSQIAFHMAASDPRQAIAWAKSLPDRDARGHALQEGITALAQLSISEATEAALSAPNMPERISLVEVVAQSVIDHPKLSVMEWMDTLPADSRVAAMRPIISQLADSTPAEAAALFDANPRVESDRQDSNLAAKISGTWALESGTDAATWVAGLPEGETSESAARALAETWMTVDSVAASEWVGSLEQSPARDAATEMLVSHISDVDPSAAFLWATTIQNVERRARILETIVGGWATTDRNGVLSAVESADLSPRLKQNLLETVSP